MTSLSQTLYELAQVMEAIEENDGEVDSSVVPVLQEAETKVAQKIDSYVHFLDAVEAQIDRTKDLSRTIYRRLKSLEYLKHGMKENVKNLMESHGLLKLDGNERSVKLIGAGGVQTLDTPDDFFEDIEVVNPKYLIELDGLVEERKVYFLKDKEDFRAAVGAGKVPSCSLLPRGKYVKFV